MGAADDRRPNLERLLGFDRLGTSAALEQGDERVEELTKCVGQQPGVGEAAGGVGFEAGQADRLEILRHLRIPRPGGAAPRSIDSASHGGWPVSSSNRIDPSPKTSAATAESESRPAPGRRPCRIP